MPIAESVLELIGNTPMVRLRRIAGRAANMADVIVKLEGQNPAGSIKDRACQAMIEEAELAGRLRAGDTIVEPTSGNTGIGLALIAAVKGYRLILCMPDDASVERRRLLAHYGAEVVLTPARKLMKGAIDRAREIVASNPRCFMPQQFDNPANPNTHRTGTALEILRDTEGTLDAFVAGVGTGGTITGVGARLKQDLPGLLVIAVEPKSSPVLGGGAPATHAIQGIGAGFVPAVLERALIDEVLACEDRAAFDMAGRLAREEGVSAGLSGGAAVWGAVEIAKRLGPGKRVVTVIADTWDRYTSVERPGSMDFII
ncbi:MAG: cysteine synthase A [Deltaproteobacteria bacterium]|nr:cysteine synthase A [Deltaproteobacteria bacterium]